jgi:ferritin-like metal-binding protein YciE
MKCVGFSTLSEALSHPVNQLYDAEVQYAEALPRLAGTAATEELSVCLDLQLDATREQLRRLEQLGASSDPRENLSHCLAMTGLLEDLFRSLRANSAADVRDAMLLAGMQRIAHFQLASYGAAEALAEALGATEISRAIEHGLNDDIDFEETLTDLVEKLITDRSAIPARP